MPYPTEVRVAPFNTVYFTDYAIAPDPSQLADPSLAALTNTLGPRVYTAPAPWLKGKDSADFLAKSLLSQYASGLARGQVTIIADPSVRSGSVIQLPNPTDGSGNSLVYVTSKTYSLQWGGAWVETDTLSYGRDPRIGLPLAHAIPTWSSNMAKEQAWYGKSLSTYVNSQGGAYYALSQDTSLKAPAGSKMTPCSAPWPVGTVLTIHDTNGNVLPHDPGYYVVVTTTTDQAITIPGTPSATQCTATVVTMGSATSPATTPLNQSQQPPTSSPIADTSLQAFVNDFTGKNEPTVTAYGKTWVDTGQCVCLANYYCIKQLGVAPPSTVPTSQPGVVDNGAGNMFNNASSADWLKIPVEAGLQPQPGDLVIFKPDSSNFNAGHVDICLSSTSAGFQGFDENWDDHTQYGVLPHQVWHSGYGSVIGWLHPLHPANS